MSAARDRDYFSAMLRELLPASAGLRGNHLVLSKNAQDADQAQTNAAFTSWLSVAKRNDCPPPQQNPATTTLPLQDGNPAA